MNFKAIWTAIRKLPVAKWIKPIWKGLLKEAIQECGDWLQKEVQKDFSELGPKAVEKLVERVERWGVKVTGLVAAIPLPAGVKDRVQGFLSNEPAALKGRLREAIINGGKDAIDSAFDESQALLISKVDSL